jgi:hypothetical protein
MKKHITIIDHKIRVKLKLGLQEYTLLYFLSEWFKTNKNKPTNEDFINLIGCKFDDATQLFLMKLKQKNFITSDYKPTNLWNSEFGSSAGFDKLWEIHAKGNKILSKQRLIVVLKKVSFEELESKLREYVQTNEFEYLKNLDVWLNPKMEHWNDPLVYKGEFKKEDKNNDRKLVM